MVHAAEREAADVGRRVEVGDERLERVLGVVHRRRDALEHEIHQRPQVGADGALGSSAAQPALALV